MEKEKYKNKILKYINRKLKDIKYNIKNFCIKIYKK